MAQVGRKSPLPAKAADFDAEFDIVVVGAGGGGLATACFSAWLGNRVLMLEKADELGGTTKKAAFWYWVPNNEPMQAIGIEDRKRETASATWRACRGRKPTIRSHPTLRHERSGNTMPARRSTTTPRPATELLAEKGALEYRHCAGVPDYWAELPEDKAPTGPGAAAQGRARHDVGRRRGGDPHDGRQAARATAVDIRTGHRVQRTVVDDDGRGGRRRGRRRPTARRVAIQGAQGGDLRHRRLHPRRRPAQELPQRAGVRRLRGAAPTRATSSTSARPPAPTLRNMNYAWMCPIVLEKALNGRPGADRHVLAVRRFDDLCRQDRTPRHQREARLQRVRRRPSSTGTRRSRNTRTSS